MKNKKKKREAEQNNFFFASVQLQLRSADAVLSLSSSYPLQVTNVVFVYIFYYQSDGRSVLETLLR